MADPVTLFTVFTAAEKAGTALSNRAEALDAAARAESEAQLADTQALQRDTYSREELSRFLSTVRANRAANGLSSTTPNARLLEADATSTFTRERLIERANARQRAANFRTSADAYRRKGAISLLTGAASTGTSLVGG